MVGINRVALKNAGYTCLRPYPIEGGHTVTRYYVCRNQGDGSVVLCKFIREEDDPEVLGAEAQAHVGDYSSLANLIEIIKDRPGKGCFVITELCKGGTLSDLSKFLESNNHKIPAAFVWRVFLAVATALRFMAHSGVTHNYMGTLANFLMCPVESAPSQYPQVKVHEFGSARYVQPYDKGIHQSSEQKVGDLLFTHLLDMRAFSEQFHNGFKTEHLPYELQTWISFLSSNKFSDGNGELLSEFIAEAQPHVRTSQHMPAWLQTYFLGKLAESV